VCHPGVGSGYGRSKPEVWKGRLDEHDVSVPRAAAGSRTVRSVEIQLHMYSPFWSGGGVGGCRRFQRSSVSALPARNRDHADHGDRNQDLDPDADADADAEADDTDDPGPRIIDGAISRSRNELIQKWGSDDHQTETIHAVNRLRNIEEVEEEEDICCEACGCGAVMDSRDEQGHFQRSRG
jgi:hypothetical protein